MQCDDIHMNYLFLGTAAGVAAARASRTGQSPRRLNELQRAPLKQTLFYRLIRARIPA